MFFARSLTAAITIFVTTADDALWLIPFLSPRYSFVARLSHALTFVVALQCVVLVSAMAAQALAWMTANKGGDELMPVVGATLAWIVALYFFVRRLCKGRNEGGLDQGEQSSDGTMQRVTYGTVESLADCGDPDRASSKPRPFAVFGLTFIGALDELTYFPPLIIGGTFTAMQLATGALVACIFIIVIITSILTTFKPLLEWLDRIPLYVVVSIFAAVLTVEAVLKK